MEHMRSTILWCLLNSQTGLELRGVTFSEARAAVGVMPTGSRVDWLVWREGWREWRPLIQVRELLEPFHRELQQEPPAIDLQVDEVEKRIRDAYREDEAGLGAPIIDISGETRELEMMDKEFIRRSHKRIKKRFKVQITAGTQKFVSHTIDISIGGLQLEDILPDWVVGYCQVLIINTETRKAIEVTCSLVENQSPNDRRRLQILPLEDEKAENEMEAWLAA